MQHMKNITNTIQNSQKINIDELLEDYKLDLSLFTDLDDRLLDIAEKWEKLSLPERIVMVLYAEFGSLRKVGSLLNVSHSTVNNYINEIRDKLC